MTQFPRGGGGALSTIDLVYLWVDGNDPELKQKRLYWQNQYGAKINPQATDKCRFIDNQELKYSLRSVEKYAPWVNNIYIVTDNQIPKWLNTNNEKIHIIDHKDIMPPEALPTFNSVAIETCICNIKNLSEYFLYANDDMFFTNYTSQDFFFTKTGYPIFRVRHRLRKKDYSHQYVKMLVNAYKLIEKKFGKKYYFDPHHSIDAYKKSDIIECNELFSEELYKTTLSKFRNEENISRVIYQAYACATGKGKLKLIKKIDDELTLYEKIIKTIRHDFHKDSIYFHTCNTNYQEKIAEYKPELICINDNEDTTDDDRVRMKNFLENYFPEKSPFEI